MFKHLMEILYRMTILIFSFSSEIWACIAPGCPDRAVKYAYEDAVLDHGNGEGVYGEVFFAALESAAFVEKDIYTLINIGLSYIPEDCDVAKAIRFAMEMYREGRSWLQARDEMIRKFYSGFYFFVSEEDIGKGLSGGDIGHEAPSNIGITIIGLLYGEGDFAKSLCTAVNCGEDTDCTAATIGAIFGIINGINAIPEEWIKPIGGNIKTACLVYGELATIPGDIEELTKRVEKVAHQVISRFNLPVKLENDFPTDLTSMKTESLLADREMKDIYMHSNGPVYKFDFFNIYVDYLEGASIRSGVPKKLRLLIENTGRMPETLNITWYTQDGWIILPSERSTIFISQSYQEFMPTCNVTGKR